MARTIGSNNYIIVSLAQLQQDVASGMLNGEAIVISRAAYEKAQLAQFRAGLRGAAYSPAEAAKQETAAKQAEELAEQGAGLEMEIDEE
jgi:hypothetical protein